MQIMIIEDDAGIVDLIKQIILKIRPQAKISWFLRVSAARAAWQAAPCELIISEWELSGESAVSLLKKIRQQSNTVPIVMLTDRADRESVLQMRRLRINAFISKPFKAAKVMARLEQLLPLEGDGSLLETIPELDFCTHLEQISPSALDLPLRAASQKLLEQHLQGEEIDLRQLLTQFQHDSALRARLIAMANRPQYNVNGTPCTNLYEALQLLGVNTCLNLALALYLKRACQLRSPVLRLHAQVYLEESERLCERVHQLVLQLRLQPCVYQSAALLHRMGELCVLQQAQSWEDCGHSLSGEQVLTALERFSHDFANALKVNWHLPMALREMIGAIYALPPANLKRDLILMRLAAVELSAEPEGVDRLRHLLGLPEAEPELATVAV